MAHIVIIGQSAAAYAAITVLRQDSVDHTITLVTTEPALPYRRDLLPLFATGKIAEREVFFAPEAFYKTNRIDLVQDKELSRINAERRKIFLSGRTQLDFDALLISDAPALRWPEIKGIRKQGVFDLARLDSCRRAARYLPFAETVFVVPASWRAVQYAVTLRQATGKEVVLVTPEASVLATGLTEEASARLAASLDKEQVRWMAGAAIEDVLGDAEVKAVRLSSGKVVACDMVVREEVPPDMRFLEETGLLVKERVCVHTNMRSSVPQVYAAGPLMELMAPSLVGSYAMDDVVAARQGECAAFAMLGREQTWEPLPEDPSQRLGEIFPADAPVSL